MGKLLNSIGQGIPNSRVTFTDAPDKTLTAMSNGFEAYRFSDLTVSQTSTISIES